MNRTFNELIPRGDFRIADARVDLIWEGGMNQVEVGILIELDNAGLPVEQVALRILNDTFVVAVRFLSKQSLTLSFDAKHIPGILKPEHYKLIADGLIEHYRSHILPAPKP